MHSCTRSRSKKTNKLHFNENNSSKVTLTSGDTRSLKQRNLISPSTCFLNIDLFLPISALGLTKRASPCMTNVAPPSTPSALPRCFCLKTLRTHEPLIFNTRLLLSEAYIITPADPKSLQGCVLKLALKLTLEATLGVRWGSFVTGDVAYARLFGILSGARGGAGGGGVLNIIAISVAASWVQGLLDAGFCTRNRRCAKILKFHSEIPYKRSCFRAKQDK